MGKGGPLTTGQQFSSLCREVEEAGGDRERHATEGRERRKDGGRVRAEKLQDCITTVGKTTEGGTRRKDKGTQKISVKS